MSRNLDRRFNGSGGAWSLASSRKKMQSRPGFVLLIRVDARLVQGTLQS